MTKKGTKPSIEKGHLIYEGGRSCRVSLTSNDSYLWFSSETLHQSWVWLLSEFDNFRSWVRDQSSWDRRRVRLLFSFQVSLGVTEVDSSLKKLHTLKLSLSGGLSLSSHILPVTSSWREHPFLSLLNHQSRQNQITIIIIKGNTSQIEREYSRKDNDNSFCFVQKVQTGNQESTSDLFCNIISHHKSTPTTQDLFDSSFFLWQSLAGQRRSRRRWWWDLREVNEKQKFCLQNLSWKSNISNWTHAISSMSWPIHGSPWQYTRWPFFCCPLFSISHFSSSVDNRIMAFVSLSSKSRRHIYFGDQVPI